MPRLNPHSLWLAACVALPFATPLAANAQTSTIQIDHAWSRPAIAGRPGVLYLTIKDSGAPDSLTAVATPIAAQAELHESFDDNGVMKMRAVASLQVAPGQPVALSPGGYHIMLMGLKQALVPGDKFPVTLTFAKAGSVTTTATVEPPGAVMQMQRANTSGTGAMPTPNGGTANKP